MEFAFQLISVIGLVLLNGFFVASEFSLVASRRTRVDELVKKGNKRAKLLQRALSEIDMYISSTQLGITLASLGLGWIGEPALARHIEPLLRSLHAAAEPTSHAIASGIAFFLITFLHIVIGELTPKTIALQKVEATSFLIIAPLVAFTAVFKPFIWVLNQAGVIMARLTGLKIEGNHSSHHSEEEIKMIIAQGGKIGTIPADEAEMVQNVFRLGDIPVKNIMVPRTDIIAFSSTITLEELTHEIRRNTHSRFPIYQKSLDTIIGFIHIKDVYRLMLDKHNIEKKLEATGIIREIIYVPENRNAHDLLLYMRKKWIHLAVVSDEYGGTAGLVSIEDIIESLVGEIQDEFDRPLPAIKKETDGTYTLDARVPIERVRKTFQLQIKGQGYNTIGGLVFGVIGHTPALGDSIQIGDITLRVEQMQKKEIKRIRLIRK